MKYPVFLFCHTFPAKCEVSSIIVFARHFLKLWIIQYLYFVKYPAFLLFQSKVWFASEGQWLIDQCTLTAGVFKNFHTFIWIFWCLQRLSHILVPIKAHILFNLMGSTKVSFLSSFCCIKKTYSYNLLGSTKASFSSTFRCLQKHIFLSTFRCLKQL